MITRFASNFQGNSIIRYLLSRTSRRFGALAATQIAGSILSLLTAVIVTRTGGAEVFGQISLGISVVAYALVTTNFGTDVSAVRIAAADPEQIELLLPAVFLIRLFFATASFAVILVVAPALISESNGRLILYIITASVFTACLFPIWIPQAIEDLKVTATCIFAPFALTFALTVLVAAIIRQGWAFALCRLGADILLAIGLTIWARRYISRSNWSKVFVTIRSLIGQSGKIASSQLIRGLAFLSDMVIVGILYQGETLGHFSAAYRIYLLLIAVGAMYFIILFPTLAKSAARGKAVLESQVRTALAWAIPAGLAGAVVVIATAPWALPLAFGQEFAVAVPALQLLAVAAAINFIHKTFSRSLIASGSPGLELLMTAVATVIGIGVKWIGAWWWGIVGISLAIVVSELLLLVLLGWAAQANLKTKNVR